VTCAPLVGHLGSNAERTLLVDLWREMEIDLRASCITVNVVQGRASTVFADAIGSSLQRYCCPKMEVKVILDEGPRTLRDACGA
jgi:hypothetical protein